MVITCDTSFLSSIFGSDCHTARAHQWMIECARPLLITPFLKYEYHTATMLQEYQTLISPEQATAHYQSFLQSIEEQRLLLPPLNLHSILERAHQLTSVYTRTKGNRSFDILHVAAATEMQATHFLSFDKKQSALAAQEKLICPLSS